LLQHHAAEGAGAGTDDGDPDLDGGEELLRLLAQSERGPGPLAPCGGELAEA
jgi:hypothetical protein